jgi:hypothetical protein
MRFSGARMSDRRGGAAIDRNRTREAAVAL